MKPLKIKRINTIPGMWNLDLTKAQGTGSRNWFVIPRVRYIEVLFHMLHYYWAEKYCSLYRGLRYIEVR